MKKIVLLLFFPFLPVLVPGQTFEWVNSRVVDYPFNPSYPQFATAYDDVYNRVVQSRLDSFATIYGSAVLGRTMVESRDTNGMVVWSVPIGDKAEIQRLAADENGNIFVGGRFQQSLLIGATDSLGYIPGSLTSFNFFLLKFDLNGSLTWKRNLSATWSNYEGISALTVDPSNTCWYATTDFFTARIISIDASGNDITVHSMVNGKLIGNISFDPWGGMYVSGAASNGIFIMDQDTFQAVHFYNMFIARFNPQGMPSWVHFGADITFQFPMVTADPMGNALFASTRYDTTSFNGVFFTHPYLTQDFFIFKMDTSGTVLWHIQQPALIIGPWGSFETGSNLFLDTDAGGNLYMGGVQHGPVDWGSGVISNTGSFTSRMTAIACIDPNGIAKWVKIGGSQGLNYMHSLAVSEGGSCYFTGSFSDSAVFDNIIIPGNNFYNFMIGKIRSFAVSVPEAEPVIVQFYPNPVSDLLYFPDRFRGYEIIIIDVTGRVVLEIANSKSNFVDVSSLVPGSYILQFKKQGEVRFGKFSKSP